MIANANDRMCNMAIVPPLSYVCIKRALLFELFSLPSDMEMYVPADICPEHDRSFA